jgi:hypothetical protein
MQRLYEDKAMDEEAEEGGGAGACWGGGAPSPDDADDAEPLVLGEIPG